MEVDEFIEKYTAVSAASVCSGSPRYEWTPPGDMWGDMAIDAMQCTKADMSLRMDLEHSHDGCGQIHNKYIVPRMPDPFFESIIRMRMEVKLTTNGLATNPEVCLGFGAFKKDDITGVLECYSAVYFETQCQTAKLLAAGGTPVPAAVMGDSDGIESTYDEYLLVSTPSLSMTPNVWHNLDLSLYLMSGTTHWAKIKLAVDGSPAKQSIYVNDLYGDFDNYFLAVSPFVWMPQRTTNLFVHRRVDLNTVVISRT